ncbi:hypothetical protein [Streptomyces umbrinus]|uniref:hypothetical protein n=1 Tax=Streptomyces umbrinus TaxID=67370 RepID=UPI0027D8A6FE|nr:hypothetical protein [Streptomyces umbrinus]
MWFEPERVSASDAAGKYERLCGSDLAGAGVVASEAVSAFHQALIMDFPELSSAGDDCQQVAVSPWTAGLDVSAAHVLMPMSWSRASETAPEVVALAGRHGLVCFDPQAEVLHLPPALRGADGLSLQPCVGLKVEDPDPDVIERAVRRLSSENWFLILEKRLGRYLQVGQGPNAGLSAGGFAVEHRDGSPDRHYRCVLSEKDQVATIFADFASGEAAWSVDTRWDKVSM